MKIIAESAFNHNGNYNELLNLALESQKAGADFFTAQVMNVNAFCKSDYDKYDLYKNTEFSASQWVVVHGRGASELPHLCPRR